MIRYFWKGLQLFIQAQLDIRDRDLDSWDEDVDKTVDVEVKASFQAPSKIKEMDSWCSQGQRPTKKNDKDSRTLKKISLPKIFLLTLHHHQVGPNSHWHSLPRKIKTVVLAKKDLIVKVKARNRILLPTVLAPLLSGRTKLKIRIRIT